MSLATSSTLRLCSRSMQRASTSVRNSSTQTSKDAEGVSPSTPPKQRKRDTSSLPPAKLRALVSLYHKSADYITPENLNDRIIHAFSNPKLPESNGLQYGADPQVRYPQLRDHVFARRKLPPMVDSGEVVPKLEEVMFTTTENHYDPENNRQAFSGQRTVREQMVVNALYGVKGTGDELRTVYPGLEMLEERAEEVQERLQKTKKTMQNIESQS